MVTEPWVYIEDVAKHFSVAKEWVRVGGVASDDDSAASGREAA